MNDPDVAGSLRGRFEAPNICAIRMVEPDISRIEKPCRMVSGVLGMDWLGGSVSFLAQCGPFVAGAPLSVAGPKS